MLCRPTGYRRERQCLKLRRQRSGLWNWTRRWPKHASLGRVLATYDWDWTSAEKEYKRTIELNPRYATAHQWYGGYLAVMGRSNEAIAERKRALELLPAGSEWTLSKGGLGHVYAVTGKKSEARTLLDELKQLSAKEYVPATSVALIYSGLGEKDQAFAWLDTGYEQRAFQLPGSS